MKHLTKYLTYLTACVLLLFVTPVAAQSVPQLSIVYVTEDGGGAGDGSSWSNALSDIQDAIDLAVAVGQAHGTIPPVWVASGYFILDTTLVVPAGVSLYGSMEGTETPSFDFSRRIPDEFTVIDGDWNYSIMRVTGSQAHPCVVDGFYMAYGSSDDDAGAVEAFGYVQFRYCMFVNCQSYSSAGAVHAVGSYTALTNDADGHPHADNSILFEGCSFTDNYGTWGGALDITHTTISNSLIAFNEGTYGGAIYLRSAHNEIINCDIVQNVSSEMSEMGGGKEDPMGGGNVSIPAAVHDSLMASCFVNTILWGNSFYPWKRGYMQLPSYTDTWRVHSCAIEGQSLGINCLQLGPDNENGPQAPHFHSVAYYAGNYGDGDFALQSNSPCLHAGWMYGYRPIPATDFLGDPRTTNGTISMGCYEDYVHYCNTPSYITFDQVATTSALLTWEMDATGYDSISTEVQIRTGEEEQWQTLPARYTGTSCMLEHLQPSTEYEVRVRTLCGPAGAAEATDWSGSGFFTTTCRGYYPTISAGWRQYSSQYDKHPLDAKSKYAAAQMLYYADELNNEPRRIDTLQFLFSSLNTSLRDIVVYMGHTDRLQFSSNTDWMPLDSLQQVYAGQFVLDNTYRPLLALPLDTVFQYNGTDNLLIAIFDNTGVTGTSSSNNRFYSTNRDSYRYVYSTSSSAVISLNSLSSPYRSQQRPDLQLPDYCTGQGCVQPNMVVEAVTDSSATVSWAAVDGQLLLWLEREGFQPVQLHPTAADLAAQRMRVEGLCFSTYYQLHAAVVCAPGDTSRFATAEWNTELRHVGRFYVSQQASGRGDGTSWANATDSLAWALDMAYNMISEYGDTVLPIWVSEGTYWGNFTIGCGIRMYGGFAGNEPADYDLSLRDFSAHPTILRAEDQTVLEQDRNCWYDEELTVDGFSITGGYLGVQLRSYSTLANCRIYGNGDGIKCSSYYNFYDQVDANGIRRPTSCGSIVNCEIFNIGLYDVRASFIHNQALNVSEKDLINCLVAHNTAIGYCNGNVVNCTFVRNGSEGLSTSGYVANSIFWGNGSNPDFDADEEAGLFYVAYDGTLSGERSSSNTVGLQRLMRGNDLVLGPHFVAPADTAGPQRQPFDYRLTQGSVCLKRGVWDTLLAGIRPYGDSVDLGCYHTDYPYSDPIADNYHAHVYVTPDGTGNGTSWAQALSSLDMAAVIASGRSDLDVWVAQGTYYGDTMASTAFVCQDAKFVGGLVGNEPADYDLSLRDLEQHQTILDGRRERQILQADNSSFDGFVLQWGYNTENNAPSQGGAAWTDRTQFANCLFRLNQGASGGAVNARNTHFDHCNFTTNGASSGGAVYADDSVWFANCLFADNYVPTQNLGAAIYATSAYVKLLHSTLVYNQGNRAVAGNQVWLTNCVVWGHKEYQGNGFLPPSAHVEHCAVEGGFDGLGNINLDSENEGDVPSLNYPSFVNPIEPFHHYILYSDEADSGDYRLMPYSACRDRGTASYIDTAIIPISSLTDLAHQPRWYGAAVDMGCYEYNGEVFCGKPDLSAEDVAARSVRLHWTSHAFGPDNFSNQGDTVMMEVRYVQLVPDEETGYMVEPENPEWHTETVRGVNDYLLANLLPETYYMFCVRSYCLGGMSEWSDTIYVLTKCATYTAPPTIGAAGVYTNGSLLPVATSQKNCYTQLLYLASELDMRPHTPRGFYLQYTSTQTVTRKWKVYIGHTIRTQYATNTSWYPIDSLRLAYEGPVRFTATDTPQEVWISLLTGEPFEYDGTSNLVIAIADTTGTFNSGVTFATHPTGDYTALTLASANAINRRTPTSSGTATRYANRPNIRFFNYCDPAACVEPTLMLTAADTNAILQYSVNDTLELQLRRSDQSRWTAVQVAASPMTLSSLRPNSRYQLRGRTLCSSGDTSQWIVVDFETQPLNCSRIYVMQQSLRSGDGHSWTHATNDLDWAVKTARVIGQRYGTTPDVWVAAGTYYGDTTGLSTAFTVEEGVNVYGGLHGYEPADYDLSQRDFAANRTILDGQGRRPVLLQATPFTSSTSSTWDGFVMQNGSARGYVTEGNVYDWYHEYCIGLKAYGRLRNCEIRQMQDSARADIVLEGSDRAHDAVLDRCHIHNNKHGVSLDNAAMVNCLCNNNNGGVSVDNSLMVNCDVVRNKGSLSSVGNGYVFNSIIWGNSAQVNTYGLHTRRCAAQGQTIDSTSLQLFSSNIGTPFVNVYFAHPSVGAGCNYSGEDWTLTDYSACLDYGDTAGMSSFWISKESSSFLCDNSFAMEGYQYDLAGRPRVQGAAVDLGCYEADSTTSASDAYPDNIVYVNPSSTVTPCDGTSWERGFHDIELAQSVASHFSIPSVWVAEGRYEGNPSLDNAFVSHGGVSVYGGFAGTEPANYDLALRDFEAHPTVLDGGRIQRVLYLQHQVAWDGFTISDGEGLHPINGAGVYMDYGTLRNCKVTENIGSYGGGLYLNGGEVVNCEIFDNEASCGGGLYCNGGWVHRCKIYNNSAVRGAGVYTRGVTLTNSLVAENRSYESFRTNVSAIFDEGSSNVISCDIVRNIDSYTYGYGKGTAIYYEGISFHSRYYNNIIWGNLHSNAELSSLYDGSGDDFRTALYADGNAVEEWLEADTSCMQLSRINMGGSAAVNFASFVNPDKMDYRLRAGSSCIDKGHPAHLSQDTLDLDGNPRIVGGYIDIGCYERQQGGPCQQPFEVKKKSGDGYSALIVWDDGGNGSTAAYEVEYALAEASAWTSLGVQPRPYRMIDSLQPDTRYKVRVRVQCSDAQFGDYSEICYFSTDCMMRTGCLVVGEDHHLSDASPLALGEPLSYRMRFSQGEMDSVPRGIDTISFQYIYGVPMTRHLVVAMRNGGGGVPPESEHIYFRGDVVFDSSASGHWVDIPLSRTFYYDGHSALVLDIFDSTYGYYSIQENKAHFYCQYLKNLLVYPAWDDENYASYDPTYIFRPTIRFSGECDSMACVTGHLAVEDISDTSARIIWAGGNGTQQLQLQMRRLDEMDFTDITGSGRVGDWNVAWDGKEIVVSNLIQYTQYEVRIRAVCGEDSYGLWRSVKFSTRVGRMDKVYVKPEAAGRADGTSWQNAVADINRATQLSLAHHEQYGVAPDVWVAEGRYTPGDIMRDKGYTWLVMRPYVQVYGGFVGNEPAAYDVSQRNLSQHASVLDAEDKCRVLYSPERYLKAEATVWDGFTLQHGWAYQGGGAYLNNFASLRNCKIYRNRADGYAGGVYMNNTEDPRANNWISSSTDGKLTAVLDNCEITHNISYTGGGVAGNNVAIMSCLIANNTATRYGAVYCEGNINSIFFSTIVNNLTLGDYPAFGNISLFRATVRGSVFWGNQCQASPLADQVVQRGHLTMDQCAIENGMESSWQTQDVHYLSPENEGSLYSPAFVRPSSGPGAAFDAGDWHITSGSFLINRGSSYRWQIVCSDYDHFSTLDLDRQNRLRQDTVDIGCYESQFVGTGRPLFTSKIYVAAGGRGRQTGRSWDDAIGSIRAGQLLARMYNVPTVWVAQGTYYGNANHNDYLFHGYEGVKVLGGFAGNELGGYDIDQRDFAAHPSILDGRGLYPVLQCKTDGTAVDSIVWDGFTIRNGYSDNDLLNGGGVCLRSNSILRNCIVENCEAPYGGGIYAAGFSNQPSVQNCVVRNNRSRYDGGGIWGFLCHVSNSLVADNRADGNGGGISAEGMDVVNCAVVNNKEIGQSLHRKPAFYPESGFILGNRLEGMTGGGVANLYNSIYYVWIEDPNTLPLQLDTVEMDMSSAINNSIVWGNCHAANTGSNLLGSITGNNNAVHGLLQGDDNILLSIENDGTDNGAFYPRFNAPDGGDYTLHPLSDCINQGNSAYVVGLRDLAGSARVQGLSVDIGPYECGDSSDCPPVAGIAVDSITPNSAMITWQSGADADGWAVQYGLADSLQRTVVTVQQPVAHLTGLTPYRDYSVKVRALCGDTLGPFSVAVRFKTLCDSTVVDTLPDFVAMRPINNGYLRFRIIPPDPTDSVCLYWDAIEGAEMYDVYLWRTGKPEPEQPTYANLRRTSALLSLEHGDIGVNFSWKVVAKRDCITKESPILNFDCVGYPRLHVTGIESSYAMSGQMLTVRYTVQNDGTGPTPEGTHWYDKIWLSRFCEVRNDGPDTNEVFLQSFRNLRGLAAGESYTNTVQVMLPEDVYGSYFLFVLTDTLDSVQIDYSQRLEGIVPVPYEPIWLNPVSPYLGNKFTLEDQDEWEHWDGLYEGDHFFYKVITVIPSPTPDLQVTNIVHPTSVFSDSEFDVSWTVTNWGEVDAHGRWMDKVCLVALDDLKEEGLWDSVAGIRATHEQLRLAMETYAVEEKSVPRTDSVAVDSSYVVHERMKFPIASHGDYVVLVRTNAEIAPAIYESVKSYNNVTASPHIMHVTRLPMPDLVVQEVQVPDTTTVGDTMVMAFGVNNVGAAAVSERFLNGQSAKWTDKVYISNSPEWDAGSLQVAAIPHLLDSGMASHEMYYDTVTFVMPDRISGTYYLYVKTDADDDVFEYDQEDNNVTRSSPLMVVCPDLEVRNIQLDGIEHLSPGDTFQVSYDVVNVGEGRTYRDSWRDALYLTHSSVFSFVIATRVQSVRHTGALEPDSMYHVVTSAVVPEGMYGDWRLHVYTDNDSTLFENGQTANNRVMASQVVSLQQPDLVVSQVSMPDTVAVGEPFTVRWTVKNQGVGAVVNKSFTDKIYYGDEQLFETTVIDYTLDAGDSLLRSARVKLPCSQQTNGVVTVRTDANQDVPEWVENNNVSQPHSVAALAPDLLAVSVRLPDSVMSGTDVPVTWVLANHGNAPIANRSVTDKFYLSTASGAVDVSRALDSVTYHLTLAPGDSIALQKKIHIPIATEGSRYLHFFANQADSALCEGGDTASNQAASGVCTVTMSPCPDLVVASAALADTLYTASVALLSYRLANIGQGVMQSTVTNRFYLSQSATIYFPDQLVASDAYARPIHPDDTVALSAMLRVPAHFPEGLAYIHVEANADSNVYEHDAFANDKRVFGPLVVLPKPVDLALTALACSDTLKWGEQSQAQLTVGNVSTAAAEPSRTEAVFFSTDTILDVDDILLGSRSSRQSLAPGASVGVTVGIEIPLGLDSSGYIIAVADYYEESDVAHRGNNMLMRPIHISPIPLPDLSIGELTLLTDSVNSGQPVQVAYRVTNVGDSAVVVDYWNDQLFLSLDSVHYDWRLLLSTHRKHDIVLGVGESYADTAEFTVPLPYSGYFYLSAEANATKSFYEHVRSNNRAVIPIRVVLPVPGDLVVRSIDAADAVVAGHTLTVTWDVVNEGRNPLEGKGLRSLLCLSADTLFDASDKVLGVTDTVSISLATGQRIAQQLSAHISGVPEGRYYLLVLTDVDNAFYEVEERNNRSSSSFQVQVTVPELAFNTPLPDTFYNNLPNDYKLVVGDQRNQTVRVHLTPDDSTAPALNLLYISYNAIGDNLNYTYSSAGQITAMPEVYIPNTMKGYYGITVYGSAKRDSLQHASLQADILPYQLMSVTPNYGGNSGKVTVELRGSRFRPGMTVWLSNGTDTLYAERVQYVDYYKSYATFNLLDADTGRYDVGVLNFCEGEAVLPQAFQVQLGGLAELAYNVILPPNPRVNRTMLVTIEFENVGNVDIRNAKLTLEFDGAYVSNTSAGLVDKETTYSAPIFIEGREDGVIPPGGKGIFPIYCYPLTEALLFSILEEFDNERSDRNE